MQVLCCVCGTAVVVLGCWQSGLHRYLFILCRVLLYFCSRLCLCTQTPQTNIILYSVQRCFVLCCAVQLCLPFGLFVFQPFLLFFLFFLFLCFLCFLFFFVFFFSFSLFSFISCTICFWYHEHIYVKPISDLLSIKISALSYKPVHTCTYLHKPALLVLFFFLLLLLLRMYCCWDIFLFCFCFFCFHCSLVSIYFKIISSTNSIKNKTKQKNWPPFLISRKK